MDKLNRLAEKRPKWQGYGESYMVVRALGVANCVLRVNDHPLGYTTLVTQNISHRHPKAMHIMLFMGCCIFGQRAECLPRGVHVLDPPRFKPPRVHVNDGLWDSMDCWRGID